MNEYNMTPQQLFDYAQAKFEELLNTMVRNYSQAGIFDPLDNVCY